VVKLSTRATSVVIIPVIADADGAFRALCIPSSTIAVGGSGTTEIGVSAVAALSLAERSELMVAKS
jgi:hypothetical protein